MASKAAESAPGQSTRAHPDKSHADKPRVLAQVRQARILKTAHQQGSVSVGEIASEIGVSEMTIRRDLVELEREGKLHRIHGGAVPADGLEAGIAVDREEPSFDSRSIQNNPGKRAIATAAAAISASARSLALDVGTTTYFLAERLADRQHCKIFTNSVRIAAQLGAGLAEVYVPGGRMRGDEMAISGPSAVEEFANLWFDVAFIGVSGVTTEGLFDYSFEDADMKRVYLHRSSQKIVLCDASKFQRMSLVHIAPLEDIDMLITDAEPPEILAAALAKAGVEVRVATSESSVD